jgi:hypothetical protein
MTRSFVRLLIFSVLALVICAAQSSQPQASRTGGAHATTPKSARDKNAEPSPPNPFHPFRQFSAILNGGAGNDHDRKIYRSGDLMRADFDDSYRVTSLASLTTWSVHPDRCLKVGLPDASTYPFNAYKEWVIDREMTEQRETIDGHLCKIENVTFRPNDDRSLVIKMKLWEAEDLKGFPIQIEIYATGNKLPTIHYTNVSLDPPDPKIFKYPAKCTSANGPAGSPKSTTKAPQSAPKVVPPTQKPPQ